MEELLLQLSYLLRLLIAGLCGAAIGYERKNRLKEAGIRTHLIVATASALMMIVSKYGFADMVGFEYIKLDPSRIASSIVTGIGFLGAGMIFVRKGTVSGLTTAAGVWATAGVGMAIGTGMYAIGAAATILIVLVQIFLHRDLHFLKLPVFDQMVLVTENTPNVIMAVEEILQGQSVDILNIKSTRNANNTLTLELHLRLPQTYAPSRLAALFQDDPMIRSVEI